MDGRAPEFWSSIGFSAREDSLLPAEELIPHDKGGPLLPEFDPGTHAALARWEKRLERKLVVGDRPTAADGAAQPKARGRAVGSRNSRAGANPTPSIRAVPPSQSRLLGPDLQAVANSLLECRQRKKAERISCPFEVPA